MTEPNASIAGDTASDPRGAALTIDGLSHSYPARPRLEIARALLHRPRLLLLDEATVGLDVKARADILGHVRRLVTEQGIGVLWATHLFDEIGSGDDLVVLHQGRILARGVVERIVAEAKADNLHSAFMQLTGTGVETGSFAS